MEIPESWNVIDGGRPDKESVIFAYMQDLEAAKKLPLGRRSMRAELIREKLADEKIADKYVHYFLFKIGSISAYDAQKKWIPAFITLLENIPNNRGVELAYEAMTSRPGLYSTPAVHEALKRLGRSERKNGSN